MSSTLLTASPLPVEIVDASPVWLPWLPVLGSLIVAAAAFFGVIVSNRTNRKAISASDDREHRSWRKDRCLDATSSMLENSIYLTSNIGHIHTRLIMSIRDYGFSGNLSPNTDEFFFRRTHPAIAELDEHRSNVHAAQAVIDAIAPSLLVDAAATLSREIGLLVFAEQEAMRFYYLLMSSSEKREKEDKTSPEKLAKKRAREEGYKENWLTHEAQMHVAVTSTVTAQRELTRVFRRYVADVEDHTLEHFDARALRPKELRRKAREQTRPDELSDSREAPVDD